MCNINEVVKVNPALSSAQLPDSAGSTMKFIYRAHSPSYALFFLPPLFQILQRDESASGSEIYFDLTE
jgi:hypothetical protein